MTGIPPLKSRILLVGISTRSLAASAAAAGYRVVSLDYFADFDQPPSARCLSLERDFQLAPTLKNLAIALRTIRDVEGVVFCSGAENEPALFQAAGSLPVLGCSPAAVAASRNLSHLESILAPTGLHLPATRFPGDPLPDGNTGQRWLVKDLRHSGGVGVRTWNGYTPPRKHQILQEYVPGMLASASFAANGREARLLGLTRQYAGVRALNARGFLWCGNVAPLLDASLAATMQQAASLLTRQCGLAGIIGLDFVNTPTGPRLLEVNPRPGASLELLEAVFDFNAFVVHLQACAGTLPAMNPNPPSGCWGKGILYTRKTTTLPDTSHWSSLGVRDIPRPFSTIPAGAPLCSLIASAPDPETCWQAILEKAGSLPLD